MAANLAAGFCGFFCLVARLTLNDISTDLANPPGFTTVTVDGLPKKSVDLIPKAYPDITTVVYSTQKLGHVMNKVICTASTRENWVVTTVQKESPVSFLEAVATTPSAGFKDDVVVRVMLAEEGVLVDMRSKSRVGLGDFGANAARIRAFLADLEDALDNKTCPS